MTANWRQDVELAIKVITLVGVAFGVIRFFWENALERELGRKTASAALVEMYDAEIAEKVEDIEFALSPFMAIRGVEAFQIGGNRQVMAEELSDVFEVVYFGIGLENGKPLAPIWFDVLRYYDKAWLCLELNVCDKRYLEGFVCSRAVDFWSFQAIFIEYYNEQFALKRSNSLRVGQGLAKFVDGCRQAKRRTD